MSKILSIKLKDDVFEETERLLREVKVSRNVYINRAVEFYNRCQKRLLVKKKLQKDVALLQNDTKNFMKSFVLEF